MPRYKGKAAYRKKMGFKRKTLTQKVAKLQRSVSSKERKFIDTQIVNTAMSATLTITQLTNLVQGVTDATRIGNQITVVGCLMRYIMNSNISTQIRVMLVQDRQTNGVIYANSDLLQDATSQDLIVSPYNADFKRRFKIHYDRSHPFDVNGQSTHFVSKYFAMNIPIRYDANAGDITDIQSSSLSFCAAAETAGAGVVNTFFIRIYYTDT